ncbi:hypothetical protein M9H77_27472 [Catharanthus roseus]|uniref:Uncharacterized protein n=1 Tax=Catharanthus roseus TaxID=4058 RepID=A0ACC0AER7_CATRO|nr:hypothetical protein M9H77_27472 [Catharanthus roseus]
MSGRVGPTRPTRPVTEGPLLYQLCHFFLSPVPRRSSWTLATVRRLCWLGATLSAIGSDSTAPSSIPVEVEVTSKPSQEHIQEPETNEELDILSSNVPDPTSVPETHIPELKDSDDEEEHPEAQAQAFRDY